MSSTKSRQLRYARIWPDMRILFRAKFRLAGAPGSYRGGHVLHSGVQEEIALRIASDADIVDFDAAMTARRMDQLPGEEFLFPDLSPEEYARVKKAPKPSEGLRRDYCE